MGEVEAGNGPVDGASQLRMAGQLAAAGWLCVSPEASCEFEPETYDIVEGLAVKGDAAERAEVQQAADDLFPPGSVVTAYGRPGQPRPEPITVVAAGDYGPVDVDQIMRLVESVKICQAAVAAEDVDEAGAVAAIERRDRAIGAIRDAVTALAAERDQARAEVEQLTVNRQRVSSATYRTASGLHDRYVQCMAERDAALAEAARMRPVVEAAQAYADAALLYGMRAIRGGDADAGAQRHRAAHRALLDAVAAAPGDVKPGNWVDVSSFGDLASGQRVEIDEDTGQVRVRPIDGGQEAGCG